MRFIIKKDPYYWAKERLRKYVIVSHPEGWIPPKDFPKHFEGDAITKYGLPQAKRMLKEQGCTRLKVLNEKEYRLY